MNYRKLSELEIQQLSDNGCQADDWEMINVKEKFSPRAIENVHFAGTVFLGILGKKINIGYGIEKKSGIRNSYISNCRIDDHVYISDVKSLIGYHIEDHVVIDNVNRLIVTGETSFGNGTKVEVLNAAGGRKVPMFDMLTSQIAYILTHYQHHPTLIQKLEKIINNYTKEKKSEHGLIRQNSHIRDTGMIKNVNIGAFTRVSGALSLEEGTISSNKFAPVIIGAGVIAKSFIISSGSTVDDAACIENTFVGQCVKIGKNFSAEDSLIFANSECFHGEACNIFAGPYTVSHHKSTLLIAGMFSFCNAGSGSNQSNHMYKLGPIHQGILERGSKTGSLSYLLWPSRIGPFSVVIGKHYTNFDSSDFPFSYILESDTKSMIIPGMNMFTIGTKRDSEKWPARDRRVDPEKLDIINFQLFNPYIMGKIVRASEILKKLDEETPEDEIYARYNGLWIKRKKIKKAINDYQLAIDIYIGNELMKHLESLKKFQTTEEVLSVLHMDRPFVLDQWIDMAGLIAPGNLVEELVSLIESDKISSIPRIRSFLTEMNDNFEKFSWYWCQALISYIYNITIDNFTPALLITLISSWRSSSRIAIKRILDDVGKEFAPEKHIGYGIDGSDKTSVLDFEAVLGSYQKNKFVVALQDELKSLLVRSKRMISSLQAISRNENNIQQARLKVKST